MENTAKSKNLSVLVFLCSAVYFVSYLTRLNYSAVMVEIIDSEGFTKAAAGAAVTGLFITYGEGQIISGLLGDKINPKKLITWGLAASALMNFAVPLCKSPAGITAVWCVNGFAQALMWPPIVRIFSEYLTPSRYKNATVKVSWGSSLGTIAIYLCAPVCVTLWGWRSLFYFVAAVAALTAFFWNRRMTALEKELEPVVPENFEKNTAFLRQKRTLGRATLVMLGIIMLAIICQGILRDGVTTWLPTYISDNFSLENAASILTGVGMPIFSIIFCKLAEVFNRRFFPNEVLCAAAFFLLCLCFLGIMCLAGSAGLLVSLVCLTVATGCMHGANVMLLCMLPPYFLKTGHVSLVSGVLNACTYVGSALSIYGVAVITENSGWGTTVKIWAAVAALGAIFSLAAIKPWKRFLKNG